MNTTEQVPPDAMAFVVRLSDGAELTVHVWADDFGSTLARYAEGGTRYEGGAGYRTGEEWVAVAYVISILIQDRRVRVVRVTQVAGGGDPPRHAHGE